MTGDPHEHEWVPLGAMEVCKVQGCPAYRAVTEAAEAELERLGDTGRQPMKKQPRRKANT